jgi:hypothetical protein
VSSKEDWWFLKVIQPSLPPNSLISTQQELELEEEYGPERV